MEQNKLAKTSNSKKAHSFTANILLRVLLGILLVAIIVSAVVLSMSKQAFTQTYSASQEKVFEQVEAELISLHESLTTIIDAIDSSWAFRLYLTSADKLDNVATFQTIYQMEEDLEKSKSEDLDRLNILVLGMNGNHYLARTETISMSDEEILSSEAVQLAIAEPDSPHYLFSHGAYTATNQNTDVIIVSKALYYQESKEIYGIVIFTLTMDDIAEYYDYFISDYTSFYLVSDEGIVFSSSDSSKVGEILAAGWYGSAMLSGSDIISLSVEGQNLTVMKRELSYFGCYIFGVIDNDAALDNLYNMPLLILICALIGALILILCFISIRSILNPLSGLVQKMSRTREDYFGEYMPIEGSQEVRQLAATYNYMLDDIRNYIDELLHSQKEQRKAEIKALQMQLNQHYIYNTLASIKWLVYQNDRDKTTKTIDAFISLLRNTISNADELITISQEVINLQNYVLINQTRYGDAVQVAFYVSHNCQDLLIPKMILQPFVENAFFHGFPSGRSGHIDVFMEVDKDVLEVKIADDGIGMAQSTAEKLPTNDRKSEHFSGIGIHNVQERLQLLYGSEFGVQMSSGDGQGTTVVVRLPALRKSED